MAAANAGDGTGTTAPLTMKLLVAPAGWRPRVVFAEEGKDVVVDFLFSLMAVPGGPYVQPGAARDAVLCAAMPSPAAAGPNSWLFRLPQPPKPAPAPKRFFNCSTSYSSSCRGYVTEVRGTYCPWCSNQMLTEAKIVGTSPPQPVAERGAGFVQGGMATYTVTDDLLISPMSNVSSIALINACAVRDLGSLQEKIVQIGYKEVDL
jgi:hypothetical protein